MAITFAFDVYGTLINPHALASSLQEHVGVKTAQFLQIWRDKQLEYSFRRGLMGSYKDFSIITRDALNYACATLDVQLTDEIKIGLLGQYRTLAAFDDAVQTLASLRKSGYKMHAFSNGLPEDLVSLMKHAGLSEHLDRIVSVHEIRTFKPDPKVYAHFNKVTGSIPAETWLVSGNPFDIIGASSCGWNTAWVKRVSTAVFDPWEFSPTATINSRRELPTLVS